MTGREGDKDKERENIPNKLLYCPPGTWCSNTLALPLFMPPSYESHETQDES